MARSAAAVLIRWLVLFRQIRGGAWRSSRRPWGLPPAPSTAPPAAAVLLRLRGRGPRGGSLDQDIFSRHFAEAYAFWRF